MKQEISSHQSLHRLKPNYLDFGEFLAQSIAVIASTKISLSNIGLIVAFSVSDT